MAFLPSYQDATARAHWLDIVAHHVSFSDHHALCLVSRQAYDIFAPKLWCDILTAVRRCGLDPGNDVEWWFDFVFDHLDQVRQSTRQLVQVLDARSFAKDAYHYSLSHDGKTLQQSFRRAVEKFPKVKSILLDGHDDLDPTGFIGSQSPSTAYSQPLRVLSLANCPVQLPVNFFDVDSLRGLVFLDISGMPGSVWPLLKPLRDLRVLKLRRKEIEDSTLRLLLGHFRLRLWSLDLGDNLLTDHSVDTLCRECFPVNTLRSSSFFGIEGQVAHSSQRHPEDVSLGFILESDLSGTFNHPDRYSVDPPVYQAQHASDSGIAVKSRLDGSSPPRKNTAAAITTELQDPYSAFFSETLRLSQGLTHLDLSGNKISVFGMEKLITKTNGQLESVGCGKLLFLPSTFPEPPKLEQAWSKTSKVFGMVGMAHLFRPVYSSNLQSLKVHHSFVTNTLSIEAHGLSASAREYIAETALLPITQSAYPQSFVPDMNPRLTSLTLTHIPRRTCGLLTLKLLHFLKLLSRQEATIEEARSLAPARRGHHMLRGIRHLRLEFDPDSMEEGYSAEDDLDAEELMVTEEPEFSFFADEKPTQKPTVARLGMEREALSQAEVALCEDHVDGEYLIHHDNVNGKPLTSRVWIGSEIQSSNQTIQQYQVLALKYNLRENIAMATPAQIIAGAPEGSLVFQTAWAAAVLPPDAPMPRKKDLVAMKDVLEELKAYRRETKASFTEAQRRAGTTRVSLGEPHLFWTGKLEVSTEEAMSHSRAAQYWK